MNSENTNFEQLTQEILSLFISHKLNLDMIYLFLMQSVCHFSFAMNKDIDKIKSELEIIYKLLPPPIEDINDDPNQQSNC